MKVTDFLETVNQRFARVRDLSESSPEHISEKVVILEDCMRDQIIYDENMTAYIHMITDTIASQKGSIANLKTNLTVTIVIAVISLLVSLLK